MGVGWSPVTNGFGAEIEGMDITRPIADADAAELAALWRDRGMLLFRGQSLTPERQVALTALFGTPETHPAREAWVEGFPQLTHIRYVPAQRDDTLIYTVDGAELANWQPWHIDTVYTQRIDRGAMLHALEVPPNGADTGFIDRAALYDAMPEALRARASGRRVLYRLNPVASANRFYPGRTARLLHKPARIAALEARVATDFPVVSHPVFFRHPESGRWTFNVTAMHALGMEDMDAGEGDALLHDLIRFSLSEGQPYFHHWRKDDVVLWDNWRFLHSAEGTPTHVTRRLRRSGVVGDHGHGRSLAVAA